MPNYRYQATTAITWRIVTELMRRHYKKDLSILELHPGGGQYDCISLYIKEGAFPGKSLCHFNQGSQHLHIFGCYSKPMISLEDLQWPDNNNYVDAFLSAGDTKQIIDQVEQVLGLPPLKGKQLPFTTPAVLSYRLISTLLERYMLARACIDVRSGWYDSSGMEGCCVRDELNVIESIKNEIESVSIEKRPEKALRFWLLITVSKGKRVLKGIVDLHGKAYFPTKDSEPWNFWHEYKNNNRILTPLVNRLEKKLWEI